MQTIIKITVNNCTVFSNHCTVFAIQHVSHFMAFKVLV